MSRTGPRRSGSLQIAIVKSGRQSTATYVNLAASPSCTAGQSTQFQPSHVCVKVPPRLCAAVFTKLIFASFDSRDTSPGWGIPILPFQSLTSSLSRQAQSGRTPRMTHKLVTLLAFVGFTTMATPARAQIGDPDVRCLILSKFFAANETDAKRKTMASVSSIFFPRPSRREIVCRSTQGANRVTEQ